MSLRPVEDGRIADAPEAVPPKILPETHLAAGQLLEAHGRIGEAIAQYQRAVAVNHNYVAAYHRLGLLLSAVGQHEEAMHALHRSVTLLPGNAVLHNNYGYELMVQQRWEDAQRAFARATELSPGFARAHVNHGMVLSRLGRFDEALDSFQAVLPEADGHYNLGLMYRGQHLYERAAAAFRHVLAINPRFTAATTQLDEIAAHIKPVFPPAGPESIAGFAGPEAPQGPVHRESQRPQEDTAPASSMGAVAEAPMDDSTPVGAIETDDVADDFFGIGWTYINDTKGASETTQTESVSVWTDFEIPFPFEDTLLVEGPMPGGFSIPFEIPAPSDTAMPVEPTGPPGNSTDPWRKMRGLDAQLQIVRNEVACLEARELEREENVVLASEAPIACEPKPWLTPLAFEEPVARSVDESTFIPGWESIDVTQVTLEQLMGPSPEPASTSRSTMAMTIIEADSVEKDFETIVSSPADEPVVASENVYEPEEDPCEDEEGEDEERADTQDAFGVDAEPIRQPPWDRISDRSELSGSRVWDWLAAAASVPFEQPGSADLTPVDSSPADEPAQPADTLFAELIALLSIAGNESRCLDEIEAEEPDADALVESFAISDAEVSSSAFNTDVTLFPTDPDPGSVGEALPAQRTDGSTVDAAPPLVPRRIVRRP